MSASVPHGSALRPLLFNTLLMIWRQELNTVIVSLVIILNWKILLTLLKNKKPCRGIWIDWRIEQSSRCETSQEKKLAKPGLTVSSI